MIVRPDAFQEVWLTPTVELDWPNGRLTIFGRGRSKSRYVAIDDVAEAVARWSISDDAPSEVDFGGPEALTRAEVADLVEQAARRPMKRRHVPHVALAAGSRALARVKPEVATPMGLGPMLDSGDAPWDDAPLRDLGIEPHPASEFIREGVSGAAA